MALDATAAGTDDGAYVLHLPADSGMTDLALNANEESNSMAFTYDCTPPTVTATAVPDGSETNVDPITATYTFSEGVSGLALADFVTTNAAVRTKNKNKKPLSSLLSEGETPNPERHLAALPTCKLPTLHPSDLATIRPSDLNPAPDRSRSRYRYRAGEHPGGHRPVHGFHCGGGGGHGGGGPPRGQRSGPRQPRQLGCERHQLHLRHHRAGAGDHLERGHHVHERGADPDHSGVHGDQHAERLHGGRAHADGRGGDGELHGGGRQDVHRGPEP
eukprot:1178336-Prorocentrum_minimum.AAC.2